MKADGRISVKVYSRDKNPPELASGVVVRFFSGSTEAAGPPECRPFNAAQRAGGREFHRKPTF